ncbi:hypothetical protein [Ideonella sp. A 288]|uniref:hypothetical protein n=1 Tax=Ideonella sp. A 288 TaxID=1962181 RepID=UPI000B4B72B0|nr:hypothetical protein [Ideonella sp. A 288]
MTTHALLSLLTLAVALTACGGGDDASPPPPTDPVPPPVASNEVPASATASVGAFGQYVGGLPASDAAEPLDIDKAMPPTSDTDEPLDLG